jgi:hypothetical protein
LGEDFHVARQRKLFALHDPILTEFGSLSVLK